MEKKKKSPKTLLHIIMQAGLLTVTRELRKKKNTKKTHKKTAELKNASKINISEVFAERAVINDRWNLPRCI